ncbi:MAG: MFS transporter [Armatimonadota bacterium]|nr:MAG: MFS transporter [Armatimonadota bacterium]
MTQRIKLNRDLAVLSAAFLFIFMGTGALQQFLIPYLEQTTTWGPMWSSLILATVYLGFVVWRLLGGYSIRALGDYWAIVAGATMYTLFAVAVLAYPRLWVLLAAAFAWSWGAALLWITSSAHVLDASRREHYGRSAGIFYSATHVGFVVGLTVLGLLLRQFGGRGMLIGAIGMTALGNIICLFVPRRDFPRELPSFSAVLRFAVSGVGRIVAVIQFAAAIGYGLLLGVFASAIEQDYGIQFVAAITMAFYVLRAVMSPFVGVLSDRLGRGRVMAGIFAVSGAALLIPVVLPGAAALAFAAAILGALTATVLAGVLALVGDSAESTSRQAMIAGLYVWRDLGVGVTILVGQYVRILFHGYQAAFLLFAMTFFLCAWLSTRLEGVGAHAGAGG